MYQKWSKIQQSLATVIPTAWYFLMIVARQCALPLYNRNRRMMETYVDVLENKKYPEGSASNILVLDAMTPLEVLSSPHLSVSELFVWLK